MDIPQFVYSSLIEVYLGYFQFGEIVNNADIYIHVHVGIKNVCYEKNR